MSDNVIEIQKPEDVRTPAPPAAETVAVTVTGFRASGNIVSNFEQSQPQGTTPGHTIALVWSKLGPVGAFAFDVPGDPKKTILYPYGSFEKIEIEVGAATGVTLP